MVLDNGSFQRVPVPGVTASKAAQGDFREHASNVLMVAGKRSKSGHPLFVGGPQIGYFYPGLTLEMDLHGPGWNARGATSAPFPGYILIGRREDFVWTLTSAGADIVDIYVETLCGGSDTKYLYRGQCLDMKHFNAGTLDNQAVEFNRTVHGPVVGYATVNGRRVAISRKRSSYLLDGVDLLLFQQLTRGRVPNAKAFLKAAAVSPADVQHVLRGQQGGRADHHGAAAGAAGQRGRGPTRGRQGPARVARLHEGQGAPAGDRQERRAEQLEQQAGCRLPRRGRSVVVRLDRARGPAERATRAKVKKHTLATLTGAMNAAATQDVRAMRFVPLLARLLKGGTAPSARATRMLELLEAWRANGGSRLDRDLDGKIDDPGAAILDAAWNRLADAAMTPVLGKPLADQLATTLHSRYDLPPGGQFGGWHMYMSKDLRSLLGEPVKGPFANRYCGGGDVNVCRAALWARARDDGRGARGGPGSRPGGVALRRHPRADQVPARPAPVHHALHEPAERNSAGHRVLRTPVGGPRARPARARRDDLDCERAQAGRRGILVARSATKVPHLRHGAVGPSLDAVVRTPLVDTYVRICLHTLRHGSRPQGNRRAAPAPDPDARA